jgi:hypothetical protein
MKTEIVTKEDIDRGYIMIGDKKVVVLHANVGDVVRVYDTLLTGENYEDTHS